MDLKSSIVLWGSSAPATAACSQPPQPCTTLRRQAHGQSTENLERAEPVGASVGMGVGEIGWKCQKNLKALHFNLGYCGLQTPSLRGSRR